MARSCANITQAEIDRWVKALKKAGSDGRLEVRPDGTRVMTIEGGQVEPMETNPWDEVLQNAADQERPS